MYSYDFACIILIIILLTVLRVELVSCYLFLCHPDVAKTV